VRVCLAARAGNVDVHVVAGDAGGGEARVEDGSAPNRLCQLGRERSGVAFDGEVQVD
jgi:hypothetical protein